MIKLTTVLALALTLACSATDDDSATQGAQGTLAEAQTSNPCYFETVFGSTYTQSLTGFPGLIQGKTKVRNHGTQTCPYKLNLEFYSEPYVSPGNVVHNTTIVSGTLAGNATQTGSHIFNVPNVRPCKFRVWSKYSDTNSSTQTWHNLGLFDCH